MGPGRRPDRSVTAAALRPTGALVYRRAMSDTEVLQIGAVRILRYAPDGDPLGRGDHALELVGAASAAQADLVAVPVGRFNCAFFDLANGMAGEFLQKLVTYGVRLAVVGDLTARTGSSRALRDFVRESNRGRQLWFVADEAELARRLETAGRR